MNAFLICTHTNTHPQSEEKKKRKKWKYYIQSIIQSKRKRDWQTYRRLDTCRENVIEKERKKERKKERRKTKARKEEWKNERCEWGVRYD